LEDQVKKNSLTLFNRSGQYFTKVLGQRLALSIIALLATILYSTFSLAQIAGTAELKIARRGHTATLLQDGRVLIVGGDNQNGMVSQAEIFDPVSLTSTLAPAAASPRTDHTATLLPDGRVLISGGRDQNGPLTSTEVYNSLTATFTVGPSLTTPRSGHTATVLADGKILMAGGDNTGSAEIYDSGTPNFSLLGGSLNVSRKFHSAALLNDGKVLIVGGVDAQNTILDSAEIYDPQSQSFYFPVNALQIPRALATLRVLPDGKVQIIGGDSDFSMEIFDPQVGNFNGVAYLPPTPELLGATLSTRSRAALISLTASQNPNLLLGTPLTPEQLDLLDLLDRADHTITELPAQNQALVAGGVKRVGQEFQVLNSASLVSSSPASVTTDQTDYAPGTIVTITGRGFQPDEEVDLTLHERPDEYTDPGFTAVADPQGNFIFMQFAPQSIDIGRTFTLTAIGQISGFAAQTAFTDGEVTITLSPGSGQSGTTLVTVGTTGSNKFDGNLSSTGNTSVGIYWDGTIGTTNGTLVATCSTNSGGNLQNCTFTVPQSSLETHTVVATQKNKTSNSGSAEFIVVGPAEKLAITSISPTTPTAGSSFSVVVQAQDVKGNPSSVGVSTGVSLTLKIGTGTLGGTTSGTINANSSSVTISGVTYSKGETGIVLTATRTSGANLASGDSAAFTVNNPSPTLSSVSPTSGQLGQTLDILFTGTNFISGVTSVNVGTGISVNSTTVNSSTSLTANITIDEGATTGNRNFSVTNSGPGGGTASRTFTVNKRTTSTSVSCFPNYVALNQTTTCTVTVTDTSVGTKSAPGGTVAWTKTSSGGAGNFSPTSCTLSPIDGVAASCSVSYTPTSNSQQGGTSHNLRGSYTSNDSTHANSTSQATSDTTVNVNNNEIATTLTVNAAAGTFGGTVDLTATLKNTSTNIGIGSQPVSFKLNGTSVGSATSNASGVATLTGASLSGIAVGTYPGGIVGTFNGDSTFYGSTGSNTLTVTSAVSDQTITVTTPAPANAAYNSTFDVAATASSGLAVSITTSGACSGSGSASATITMTSGIGSCTVQYNQAGNDNYNAAPQVTRNVRASKIDQTITLSNVPGTAAYNSTFTPTATSTSGLAVAITVDGVCSINGSNLVTMTSGTGDCTVKANQPGNENYNAATEATAIAAATRIAQTITLSNVPASAAYNSTFTPTATSTSGLAVAITVDGVCSINGSNLVTMTSGTGDCTVKANQAGDANYNAAAQITQATTAQKVTAIISLGNLSHTYNGTAKFATATTDPVGLSTVTISYSQSGSPVAAPTNAGSYAVLASLSNDNYQASDAIGTLVISKADATIKVVGYTGVYDGAAHGASGTASGVGYADLSNFLNLGAKFTDVPGGKAHWTFSGAPNYNYASGDVDIVISKANASCAVTSYDVSYDGIAHTATGSCAGVNSELLSGLNLSGTTHTAAGTYYDTWTFTDSTGNYNNITNSAVTDKIIKANATINVVGYTGVYDGAAHGASGSATGVLGENLSSFLNLGAKFTDVPGGKAHWTFSGAPNYNYASGDVDIVITYNFTGFFRPIDNSEVNVINAGSAVPVKFSLNGNQGMDIFATGYPKYTAGYTCGTAYNENEIATWETVTAGGSSLNYDATTGQYNYVWKTDKTWGNASSSCRQLWVMFKDGTLKKLDFKFKK
jgi:hypothetical protein